MIRVTRYGQCVNCGHAHVRDCGGLIDQALPVVRLARVTHTTPEARRCRCGCINELQAVVPIRKTPTQGEMPLQANIWPRQTVISGLSTAAIHRP